MNVNEPILSRISVRKLIHSMLIVDCAIPFQWLASIFWLYLTQLCVYSLANSACRNNNIQHSCRILLILLTFVFRRVHSKTADSFKWFKIKISLHVVKVNQNYIRLFITRYFALTFAGNFCVLSFCYGRQQSFTL